MLVCKTVGRGVARVARRREQDKVCKYRSQAGRTSITVYPRPPAETPSPRGFPDSPGRDLLTLPRGPPGTQGGGYPRNSPGFAGVHQESPGILAHCYCCCQLFIVPLYCHCSSMVLSIVFVDFQVFGLAQRRTWISIENQQSLAFEG